MKLSPAFLRLTVLLGLLFALASSQAHASRASAAAHGVPDLEYRDTRALWAKLRAVLPDVRAGETLAAERRGFDFEKWTLALDSEVVVNFVRDGARIHNSLGWYDARDPETRYILWRDASAGSTQVLEQGSKVSLGLLPAGTQLRFFIREEGADGGETIIYQDSTLNAGGKELSAGRFLYDDPEAPLLVGFEDRPGSSDISYSDLIFSVSVEPLLDANVYQVDLKDASTRLLQSLDLRSDFVSVEYQFSEYAFLLPNETFDTIIQLEGRELYWERELAYESGVDAQITRMAYQDAQQLWLIDSASQSVTTVSSSNISNPPVFTYTGGEMPLAIVFDHQRGGALVSVVSDEGNYLALLKEEDEGLVESRVIDLDRTLSALAWHGENELTAFDYLRGEIVLLDIEDGSVHIVGKTDFKKVDVDLASNGDNSGRPGTTHRASDLNNPKLLFGQEVPYFSIKEGSLTSSLDSDKNIESEGNSLAASFMANGGIAANYLNSFDLESADAIYLAAKIRHDDHFIASITRFDLRMHLKGSRGNSLGAFSLAIRIDSAGKVRLAPYLAWDQWHANAGFEIQKGESYDVVVRLVRENSQSDLWHLLLGFPDDLGETQNWLKIESAFMDLDDLKQGNLTLLINSSAGCIDDIRASTTYAGLFSSEGLVDDFNAYEPDSLLMSQENWDHSTWQGTGIKLEEGLIDGDTFHWSKLFERVPELLAYHELDDELFYVPELDEVTAQCTLVADGGGYKFSFGYFQQRCVQGYVPGTVAYMVAALSNGKASWDGAQVVWEEGYSLADADELPSGLVDELLDEGVKSGYTVDLDVAGQGLKGEVIGFYLLPNARVSEYLANPKAFSPRGYNDNRFRQPLFSTHEANPLSIDQALSFKVGETVYLVFEDKAIGRVDGDSGSNSDSSYNDLIMSISGDLEPTGFPVRTILFDPAKGTSLDQTTLPPALDEAAVIASLPGTALDVSTPLAEDAYVTLTLLEGSEALDNALFLLDPERPGEKVTISANLRPEAARANAGDYPSFGIGLRGLGDVLSFEWSSDHNTFNTDSAGWHSSQWVEAHGLRILELYNEDASGTRYLVARFAITFESWTLEHSGDVRNLLAE